MARYETVLDELKDQYRAKAENADWALVQALCRLYMDLTGTPYTNRLERAMNDAVRDSK